jgi:hypothetical protein
MPMRNRISVKEKEMVKVDAATGSHSTWGISFMRWAGISFMGLVLFVFDLPMHPGFERGADELNDDLNRPERIS